MTVKPEFKEDKFIGLNLELRSLVVWKSIRHDELIKIFLQLVDLNPNAHLIMIVAVALNELHGKILMLIPLFPAIYNKWAVD